MYTHPENDAVKYPWVSELLKRNEINNLAANE